MKPSSPSPVDRLIIIGSLFSGAVAFGWLVMGLWSRDPESLIVSGALLVLAAVSGLDADRRSKRRSSLPATSRSF